MIFKELVCLGFSADFTVRLNKEPVIEHVRSNVTLLKSMIKRGYNNPKTMQKRSDDMEAWLADPQLLEPYADAEELYRYLNFDQIPDYENSVAVIPVKSITKAS